jgi:hypothetical protein
MSDYFGYGDDQFGKGGMPGFLAGLPPNVRAAVLFAIPFIVVDLINYFSAGMGLVISLPILALMYTACGALAAKFAGDDGQNESEFLFIGATSGLLLWLTSTVVNVVISLIVGTASLGTTLLLGVPYLCLCAPAQLIGGGLLGTLGGLLYKMLGNRSQGFDDGYY